MLARAEYTDGWLFSMKPISLSSLRVRLVLLVLVGVLPVLLLMLHAGQEQRQLAMADVLSDTDLLARLTALQERQLVDATRQLLVALAQAPDLRSGEPVRCSDFLSNLLERYARYLNIGLIDAQGYVVCSALPYESPVYAGDRAYFRGAVETLDFSIGDYQIGRITGMPSVNLGYPVLDDTGQVQGVVFAAVDYRWLSEVEAEAQSQLPERSTITKIDAEGTVLIQYPDPAEGAGQPLPQAPLAKTVTTERTGVTVAPGGDGTPYVYAFAPLYSTVHADDVFVIIGVPEDAAFGPANRRLTLNLLGLGITGGLALAAAWIAGDRFVLRHVRALVNTAAQVAAGDLSARTGLPHGDTEHEQLARAFDRMAAKLQQREAERDQAEEALRHSEEMYRTVTEASPSGVTVTDLGAKITYASPRTLELHGFDHLRELVGRSALDLIHPEERERAKLNLQKTLEEGIVRNVEYILLRRDGSCFTGELSATLIRDASGKPQGYVAITRDITERKQAQSELERSVRKLQKTMVDVIYTMATVVEVRDPYTAGHQRKVAALARAIAEELSLPGSQTEGLRMAALIHDIGKIYVPAEILTKPGRLTGPEFALIRAHPKFGHEVLKTVEFPWPVADIVLQHHERMDGSGYPQGLSEKSILREARILAVADVVEAMSSYRPYRPALGIEQAIEEITAHKGTLYDAEVVEACVRLFLYRGFRFEQGPDERVGTD
jgi:PAS domain S-box-containing protein/putative nucleotidyltransferase with HDIG domain